MTKGMAYVTPPFLILKGEKQSSVFFQVGFYCHLGFGDDLAYGFSGIIRGVWVFFFTCIECGQ